jgi:hypothetical protein
MESCRLLLQYEGDVNMQDYSFGDCNTPCHKSIEGFVHTLRRAAYSGSGSSGSGRHLEICLLLIDRRADMSVVNAEDETVADMIARYRDVLCKAFYVCMYVLDINQTYLCIHACMHSIS